MGETENKWLQGKQKVLSIAVSSNSKLQEFADEFSHHFSIARMHATQLYDRIAGVQGLEMRAVVDHRHFKHGDKQKTVRAILLVHDLIHHPPPYVHPDELPILKLLNVCEIIVHVNIARVSLDNTVFKSVTCIDWFRGEIQTLALGEAQKKVIDDFLLYSRKETHKMEMMAAGARLAGKLLPMDIISHECLLSQEDTSPARE